MPDSKLTVDRIRERLERERRFARDVGCPTSDLPVVDYLHAPVWSCGADPGPMTTAQAHKAMQVHLECSVDRCRVRRRARNTLVDNGRMVLDERAEGVPDVEA
ncbi:hypothetical protein OH799_32510 [Nocardia sp. NBC_00881]|uniref:hypothetical protein n=1 Tax=Nocardia sp. NBC_00881 TaxID=2975995 RepID=UPI00386DB906|nr:hypothetical protein OH799_32510 [Nocardia sp. NBC_00881]